MLEKKCRTCNVEFEGNDFVVVSSGTCICKSCIEKIAHIYIGISQASISNCDSKKIVSAKSCSFVSDVGLRPKDVKECLDEYVVGQEVVKKVLAVASYNHFKRIEMNDMGIQKSNILLIGPTGSGKTYLIQTLAKVLNVPLAIIQATTLTEAGYIGDDVESCVQRLLEKADGDVKLAEHGIVFIDEIDKLTSVSSENKRQVGGKGVQQALLPILEGTKIWVPVASNDNAFNRGAAHKVEIDTTNILFICCGAFPDAEKIIKNRISGKNNIGFTSINKEKELVDEGNLLLKVNNDDLKEFGLIPELLGRLPIVAPLENLTVDILKRILIEPKDSIISQYKRLFSYDSINLVFDDESLNEIAQNAISKGTGARSLRGILEELMLDIMYESPSDLNVSEIHITKDYVTGKSGPYYINNKNN